MPLRTDYTNDILDTSKNTERKYNIKNSNGTIVEENVTFEDVTDYSQEGSRFGASDINATNEAVNNINVYVGEDKKLHFVNGDGADSVLPFSNGIENVLVHNTNAMGAGDNTYTYTATEDGYYFVDVRVSTHSSATSTSSGSWGQCYIDSLTTTGQLVHIIDDTNANWYILRTRIYYLKAGQNVSTKLRTAGQNYAWRVLTVTKLSKDLEINNVSRVFHQYMMGYSTARNNARVPDRYTYTATEKGMYLAICKTLGHHGSDYANSTQETLNSTGKLVGSVMDIVNNIGQTSCYLYELNDGQTIQGSVMSSLPYSSKIISVYKL